MNANLVEPGVKYFLNETLKQCQHNKYIYYNQLYNIVLFMLFIFVLGGILVYTYKNKENSYQRKQREINQGEYLASKIHKIKMEKQRERGQMITNIPEFESSQHIQTKKFL